MTVFDREAAVTIDGPTVGLESDHFTLPGFVQLPPAVFWPANQGQRDTLSQITGMTVWNTDAGTLQSYVYNTWGNHVLYAPVPTAGDTLTYDPNTGTWVPTPVSQPIVDSLKAYGANSAAIHVRQTFHSVTKTGTGTGTMTLSGLHSLLGSTDANYRIDIDSSGTTSWDTATFKWSADNGTTYTATNVPVASGSTSGRQVLSPILLQDDVYVLFSTGTYVAADNWTFTILAANNQHTIFGIDSLTHTATSIIAASDTVELNPFDDSGDASSGWRFVHVGDVLRIAWAGLERHWEYDISDDAWSMYDGTTMKWRLNLTAIAASGGMYLSGLPFNLDEISTPSTPAANNAKFYAKDVAGVTTPFWLDSAATETNLLTGQHPLNTGDPHDQYALVGTAETISATWTFSADPRVTNIEDTGGTNRIALATSAPFVSLIGETWVFASAGTNVLLLVTDVIGNAITEAISQAYVATTDATATTLWTGGINDTVAYFIKAYVVARRTGGTAGTAGDQAEYERRVGVWWTGGVAAIKGGVSAAYTREDVAAYDVTFDVTGATVRLRVTGVANTNISWRATVHVWTSI